jgi:hypothetical protein
LDELELSICFILPPASHPAANASAVGEFVAELVPAGGKTRGVDVVVELYRLLGVENSNIIGKSSRAELGVLEESTHSVFLMPHSFGGIKATGVILSNTNNQLVIFLQRIKFMCCSDDLDVASVVVIM